MNNSEDEEFARIEKRWKSDVDLKLDRVDSRVRVIERLVWAATGGVVVLGTVSLIGISILRDFGTKMEAMTNQMATLAADYYAQKSVIQRQLDRLERRK